MYEFVHSAEKAVDKTEYWNENDRFRSLDLLSMKCVIIYCGANTGGTDGIRFAREYPL